MRGRYQVDKVITRRRNGRLEVDFTSGDETFRFCMPWETFFPALHEVQRHADEHVAESRRKVVAFPR